MTSAQVWVLRVAGLGVVFSGLALIPYVDGDAVCAAGDCDGMVATVYSTVLGLPSPILAGAYFGLVIVLALSLEGAALWRTLAVLAGPALVASAWLAAAMVRLGDLCRYCVAVHAAVAAIAIIVGVQLGRHQRTWLKELAPRLGTLAVLVVAAGAAWYSLRPLNAPLRGRTGVLAHAVAVWNPRAASPGVAFVDPSCPHCARIWPEWTAAHNLQVGLQSFDKQCVALAREADPRFVSPPPEQMRVGACRAGVHVFCASQQGRADAFLQVLFGDIREHGEGLVGVMDADDYAELGHRAGLDLAFQRACAGEGRGAWSPSAMPSHVRRWFAEHLVEAARVRGGRPVPLLILTAGSKS